MKRICIIVLTVASLMIAVRSQAARKYRTLDQWKGRIVAFLGDSMTDERHIGTSKNYWQYLDEMLGIRPVVYGVNGHQWTGVMQQAAELARSGREVDAIVIFAGTNDFNAGVPIGRWYGAVRCGGRRRANRAAAEKNSEYGRRNVLRTDKRRIVVP